MIKLNGYIIKPTIFPDKTSQVWKLPREFILGSMNQIEWQFENEAEIFHLAQLTDLVYATTAERPGLFLTYLPYARQDKACNNESTFAFQTFARILNTMEFRYVNVFDPHNIKATEEMIHNVRIQMPDFTPLLVELGAAPVYPDEGAANRYHASYQFIIGTKDRDQVTGKINGIKLNKPIEPRTYLIVDDICDGGRTFIELAKLLYAGGAKEVHLYVSHGIFSRGLDVLYDAGIKRIFTRNGEVVK